MQMFIFAGCIHNMGASHIVGINTSLLAMIFIGDDMLNLKESEYFKRLPELIQDTVIQGNIQFIDEDELRKFVAYLGNL